MRAHEIREALVVGFLHVLRIEPFELLEVDAGRGTRAVGKIKDLGKFVTAELFHVAVAPAQTGEVVEDGFGQKTAGFVFHDGNGTVALRKLLAIGAVDEREMRKDRHFGAQRFIKVDLTGGVVDVVCTADHVTYLHIPVIHHHGEIVGGNAVAHDDEVIQFLIGNGDRAVNGVVPGDVAVVRVTEADDGLHAFRNGFADAVFRTPAAVVAGFDPLGALFFAHGVA